MKQATKQLRHPEDLLQEFFGRVSVFGALGLAVLEKTGTGAKSDVCSEGLAQGLCMLASDYSAMEEDIREWLEVNRVDSVEGAR